MRPCRRCGGDKGPGQGRQICDSCRLVVRERQREEKRRWYAAHRDEILTRRRENRPPPNRVSTEPFRRALRERGWSRSHLARLLGWFRRNGRPDEPRVRHTLQRPSVNRATALLLAGVLGLWPVDLGL